MHYIRLGDSNMMNPYKTVQAGSSLIAEEILQKIGEYDNFDLESLYREMREMQEKQKYLQMHNHPITRGKGVDTRWRTQLGDKRVARKRREDLEAAIVEYYFEQQMNPTVEEVFKEWLEYKVQYDGLLKQSFDRYENDFKRFFYNDYFPMAKRRIKQIDEYDIEEFVKLNISNLHLSSKAHSGMRTIINGIFKYAKKHKYTDLSISQVMGDIDIAKNAFKSVIRSDEKEVFNTKEIHTLLTYMESHDDIFNQGIHLAFLTGVRTGELSTLKYSDLVKEKVAVTDDALGKEKTEIVYKLCINRTEIKVKRGKENGTYEVSEKTKTAAGTREIYIGKQAVDIIEKVHANNPNGEFLFMNRGKRICGNKFSKRLCDICKKLNMRTRTMHKVRKTYGSILLSSGMDETLVARQMGHTDVSTTKQYYYYNFRDEQEANKQVQMAMQMIG